VLAKTNYFERFSMHRGILYGTLCAGRMIFKRKSPHSAKNQQIAGLLKQKENKNKTKNRETTTISRFGAPLQSISEPSPI
jgi:hypothetical protein